MLSSLLSALAELYPWSVEPTDDLERALAFLPTNIDAETVVSAGNGVGMLLCSIAPCLLPFVSVTNVAVWALVVATAAGCAYGIRKLPLALATARRTAVLGEAPDLIGRAVLRMRIAPTAESAAAFAARTGRGPLAASLDGYVRRASGTPRSGLADFGAEWADWHPSLRRAMLLLEAAADAPAAHRTRMLDRSLSVVLDGTRDRMAEFAASIRGPATGLYAFGVLLPLALVAVLPAARIAGVPVTITAIVAVYDLLLPLIVLSGSAWLLARRPVAFPPPNVARDHPDVFDTPLPTLTGSVTIGVGLWLATPHLPIPEWGRLLLLPAGTFGTFLVCWYRPIRAVRNHARAVESNLTDGLYLIGRRIVDGQPVEMAIEHAADEVAGATGTTLSDAARVQRQLQAGVRESFLGEYGALADVPSSRSKSTAALLALAAREGRPAGSAVIAMADHLEELLTVEHEARRELANITSTLRSTATVFGPLVAGATVALAEGMGSNAFTPGGETLPTESLGLAVGAYVLLLAAVLTALAVGLERGLDRALVGYQVGGALLSAVTVYLAAIVGVGLLV